ncbi:nephrocystin-4 isoform X1 [Pangasianodon hypophthalmus]|uniref:nephrocystin-4 isoform X1 n=1 Tax=Pangasianodon hypophthalmus TaxID=310915 RepID=UPI002307952E|nr:nephrocystin-4 isoform X1 [Pangasianodon hypophthalmus]
MRGDITHAVQMSEWKRIFDENRVIPPPNQTARLAQGPSQAFQLVLERLDGLHLNQAEEVRSYRFELRVSLFDNNLHRFFGRTWKSEPHQATKRNQEQPSKVHFNEVVYFHTSLCLASVVAVVELVSLSPGTDTSQNAVGQGFGILQLFSGQAEGEGRLTLFHGTPRALLHPTLRDPLQMNAVLSAIEGTQLLYYLQPHPALNPIMHLLPPNIMVSGHELIPGVLPPSDSTGDALQRPRLLPAFSCVLERVCVSLAPSVQAFEADLLERLNNDRNNTGMGAEVRSVVVQERRLHVGVHNGLGWVDGPQVMVLEPRAGGSGGLKQSSTETNSSALMLRGNVELRMIRHPAFSLLFQLEYVFSVPLAGDGKMPSMAVQRAVFMQCVRWGVWSPFSDPDGPYESVCVSLQGGALPNPYGVMVYTAHTHQTDAERSVIKFKFIYNTEGTTSTATPKSISQEKPQPKKWHVTSQDESKLGLEASPLRTTRGPGLSLSQLAVASHYPTLSHTTGSPWQQQLPAPLALSPMASAHQLSHVVHPAVGIAHLEVSAMEREGMRDAPEEECDLHELTFTPVHAPVITLGTHTTSSSRTGSRGFLAHLFSSRFPEIRDDLNQVAELLDPDEPVNFDPHREEADPLQANTLLLQFLAFTRVHQAGVNMEWPSTVHFTFQLYRFPPVTTQRLKLVASEASSRPDYPCILFVTNRDGSVGSGPPGLQLQYRVDPAFLKPGERVWFLRYLALHTLHIDVWDSDSLLLIGSAAVQLKHLLRQGRAAVQVIHELEVISTEYLQDASLAREHAGGQRAMPAMTVYTIVKGRLHIRLGNIGGVVQKNPNSSVLLPPSRSHVIQPSQTPTGFQGGSLSSNTILNLNARNARRAQRLPDIDGELASLLQSRMREVDGARLQSRGETEEVRQRKIDRMAAVRQYEENTTSNTQEKASYMRRKEDRAQHSQDLRLIEAYRERCKVEGIINMLSQAITTTHTIYATLGTAEFFEFVLKNPFNIPQTVTIECEDPELSVIVNAEEWRYFKDLTKTCTPLEVEMFHMKEGSSTPQVYLRPRESIHIPLKYQSFVSGHVLLSQDSKTSNSLHFAHHQQYNTVMAKSIKVFFRAADSQPLAICQVRVEPTPHIVDQTFRFYQPELSFFKKAIRLPPAEPGKPDACSRLQVRCSDPNVICHVISTAPGEPQDIYLKVPGAPSPQIKTFVITVFNDPWLASPTQTWQVYMHYLQKMDISCVCGTLSWHSLVLRGTQSIRKVKCYTSHPLELQVDPEEVFALPALAVQDIRLGVKALHSGSCFRYLNVVDVDTRQLVASWLLCLTCRQPVISRAFEIQVPVGGGRGSNKKISFTNPYPSSRGFRLCSDHPDLLQFKEEKFQIEGGASYNIGLRFAPSQSAGTEEILVFINDLDDKNEETYCIKVVYR